MKPNRIVVHSEDEAWEHFRPVVDAICDLDLKANLLSPRLVFFLIDPVQSGFSKFKQLSNGHDSTPLFWDSFDEAQLYKKEFEKDYPQLPIEICATLLIDDTGIAVRPKETK